MTSLLGIPETIDDWWAIARAIRARRGRSVESLIRQGQWEERVSAQLGRWPLRSPHGTEPSTYVPADVLVLRTLAAGLDLGLGLPDPSQAPPYRGGLAALVFDGVPHWLTARTAQGITHSEPPPAEMLADLRLPYDEQVVWFGSPTPVGTAGDLVSDFVRCSVRDARGPLGQVRMDDVPWELAVGSVALVGADPGDAPARDVQVSVEGVVLLAGAEGHPVDLMAWVLACVPPPSALRSRPIRCIVPARRSQAELAPAVANLMAVVAWGSWQAPTAERLSPRARRGEMRRWMRHNDLSALGPVRVLDAPRHVVRPAPEAPIGTHASPVTHLRRGHWRRQWRPSTGGHVPTWITPVLVNPTGADDGQVVVWRLPGR